MLELGHTLTKLELHRLQIGYPRLQHGDRVAQLRGLALRAELASSGVVEHIVPRTVGMGSYLRAKSCGFDRALAALLAGVAQ
jgi:hypothetical protein